MITLFRPRTWEELFALPNLSPGAVPREQMVSGKLVGDYEMDAKTGLKPCGIAQCHKDHRHGYIVALSSGLLSYVGRDCGRSQFGAEWSRMRSAFTREKREQSKERALRALRAGLHAQVDNWPSLESEATAWARSVLAAFDEMPATIRQAIESCARAGDISVPGSRYETEEEVKRRVFRESRTGKNLPPPQLITFERGPLRGLAALRPGARVDRLLDVVVPNLLGEAKALADGDSAVLDDFGKMSKRLTDIVKQLDNSVAQMRQFVEEQNLGLLRFIRPVQLDGVTAVRFESDGPLPKFVIERK